jgi:eukaryotic-like serine/threonine-protein kinase
MLTGDVPFHGENQVSVAMKHVREDLPDLQSRRPEASATLASVLDRMTDKDLRRRYPDAATLEADLEEALAIEAARSGRSTGEATAVLRTLPPSARRRLPFRLRHPLPVLGVIAVLAIATVAIVLLAREGVNRSQRGTGPPKIAVPAGNEAISLKRNAATDLDPLGDGTEHADEARLAVDREPGTMWTTESYNGGVLTKPNAGDQPPGVGLYVDAEPGVAANRLTVQTPTPGWRAEIYGAPAGRPPETLDGWTELAGGAVRREEQPFRFDTGGTEYRYYLVWITDLPPGDDSVSIDEVGLVRPRQR